LSVPPARMGRAPRLCINAAFISDRATELTKLTRRSLASSRYSNKRIAMVLGARIRYIRVAESFQVRVPRVLIRRRDRGTRTGIETKMGRKKDDRRDTGTRTRIGETGSEMETRR